MPSSLLAPITEGLSFDDVLLVPHYSDIDSRDKNVDTTTILHGKGGDFTFEHPIVPANMDTVVGQKVVGCAVDSGGLVLLHRFQSIEDQIKQFRLVGRDDRAMFVGASVGVNDVDRERYCRLSEAGVKIFCVDVAHADSRKAYDMVKYLNSMHVDLIIAGNVATATGARRLWDAGADVVKVGIGPGSLCTTRIETGCGVPQITALIDVIGVRNDEYANYERRGIIADGGIKNGGDCVKALALADMVMIGNLFASTDEAPGEAIKTPEGWFKRYVGSSTHKTSHVEGVRAWVKMTGPYKDTFDRLMDGITSGCSYNGANTVRALQYNPKFIRITSAGMAESYPHGVAIFPEK